MLLAPRPALLDVPAVPHGSVADEELVGLGLRRADVLDFSASLNPLGASPAVYRALATLDVTRYPDDRAVALRAALAAQLGLGMDHVLAGNGSAELIWLLAMAYLCPGRRTLVVSPTFGEYERACRIAGAGIEFLHTDERRDFQPDAAALCDTIRRRQPNLTFLCNPNNPTGWLLSPDQLLQLADAHEAGLLVVDEAYLPFVPNAPDLAREVTGHPLALLRSLTKAHGLAGLRLGYLVAHPEVVTTLERVRPPWSVNSAAQIAGLAALQDTKHLERSLTVVHEARRYLLGALEALRLKVIAGPANFLLIRVGDARLVRQRLLARGICVRDCTSFGLPGYIRVGIRRVEDCRRLVEALAGVMESDG